jgi:hypothetical protein
LISKFIENFLKKLIEKKSAGVKNEEKDAGYMAKLQVKIIDNL